MPDWIAVLGELAARGEAAALLTVARIRGSAPRETGARMIVTASETIGSIGGGQLEYQCARIAVGQLRSAAPPNGVRRFALGANCGQCCGGVVEVMFEYLPESRADWLERVGSLYRARQPVVIATLARDGLPRFLVTEGAQDAGCPAEIVRTARRLLVSGAPPCTVDEWLLETVRPGNFQIALFGAGHVGTAVVDILSRLDCTVRWIDSRRDIFPPVLPANVAALESAEPALEVAAMPAGTYYLVMTHSHPLDLEICAQVLERDDAAYCGLIGSASKRRRFERLLKKRGLAGNLLDKLVCPVGVPGIAGKKPAEIALAVAAQLLQTRDRESAANGSQDYLVVRA